MVLLCPPQLLDQPIHKYSDVYIISNICNISNALRIECSFCMWYIQEAQLPQRNGASAAHVYLGWLSCNAQNTAESEMYNSTIVYW